MATINALVTAEEYLQLPDQGQPTELVRGQIVMMNMPGFFHGEVCSNIAHQLRLYLDREPLGRVITNDAGVITEQNPDSVRGADVAYYSYATLPRDLHPRGYPEAKPAIVFEVRSPSDQWTKVLAKAAEYLNAGVAVVCVVDPETGTVNVYTDKDPVREMSGEDELKFPTILPGFSVPVSRFF